MLLYTMVSIMSVEQREAYIPYSFLGYLSAKQTGEMSNGNFNEHDDM